MAENVPAFSLRLRNPQTRALLREVAEHEHISQNELIEQAIEHELAIRGARLAEDLAAAARRLSRMSHRAYSRLLTESDEAFVAGEAQPEPIRAYALHGRRAETPGSGEETGDDPLGVLAAFSSGRR